MIVPEVSSHLPKLRPLRARLGRIALGVLAGLFAAATALAGPIYYVDNTSGSCSNSGPGTELQPYCTIAAAITQRGAPGVTIYVKPGTYREQIELSFSGAPSDTFRLKALGGPVVVDGGDDFSNSAAWTQYSGNVWRASSVNWSPKQVFADDARLAVSTLAPGSLPSGSYIYVSGQGLYVNVGGGNPGPHHVIVGRRTYGIRASNVSWFSITGFTALHTEDRGIFITSGCSDASIVGNTAAWANYYGLAISGCTRLMVANNASHDNNSHGCAITSSSTAITFQDNLSYSNADPKQRIANGVYVYGSSNCLFLRNQYHHNQDTGQHFQTGSNNNVSLLNRSWQNGDHGYDHLRSTGSIHIGDVAWGNYKDGFSIEGTATGTQLYNCIATDNGLTTNEFDLWVEGTSTSGFVSNYNLFWNSTTQKPIKYVSTLYSSVAAYSAATGQDVNSIQADPRFANPAAGDFHLLAGSPAIDNANSGVSNWPSHDADNRPRVDDPGTANGGVGPIAYGDRGALEFVGFNLSPVANLTVTPSSGIAPVTVTADGSGSYDPDGSIVSYQFDFGDGTVVGPQPGSSASHPYTTGGTRTVTLTVRDDHAASGTATASVAVTANNLPPDGAIATPTGSVTIRAGECVQFSGAASDPDNNLPLSYAWNFGGGAPTQSVLSPGAVTFATPGTYTVSLTVSDGLGLADPAPDTRLITVNARDDAPRQLHWTIIGPTAVTFDWEGTASTLRYGTTPAYDDSVTGEAPSMAPVSSCGPFWEAQLTGLEPNTLYHYSVGAGADHTFRTPPPPGATGFTIAAEADIGDATKYPRMGVIQSQIAAASPAFVLANGDLTYGDENGQSAVDRHYNDVMVWSQDAAYMPSWGNHEWDNAPFDDLRNYKGRFDLPNPQTSPGSPAVSCCGEDWSWFDYGAVRFIGYPDKWPGAWSDWNTKALTLMDQAQADPSIRYIVTFGHRPAYSSGHHDSETELQTYMNAMGASHGKFVLDLSGHSHDYERTYPQNGVVHVCTGTGGGTLETDGSCLWLTCQQPSWSAFRAFHLGHLLLSFESTGISGRFIAGPAGGGPNDVVAPQGSVIDSFFIGVPVVTAPAAVTVAEGNTVSVNVTVTDPESDPITSLTADLSALPAGNNAVFTPNASNTAGTLTWTPTYNDASAVPYGVRFTASNGFSGTAITAITVTNVDHAPAVTSPAAATVNQSEPLTVTVTAADPDGDGMESLTADLTSLPAGNNAVFTPNAAHTSGTLAWTPGPNDVRAQPYHVTFTAANALAGTSATDITVTGNDAPPVVTAPATATGLEGTVISVSVTASDPDGQAITSFSADLSGLPAGHNAVFTEAPDHLSGTLTWTPALADVRTQPYVVTFAAANVLQGTASTAVTVTRSDVAPVVTAPVSVSGAEGAAISVNVSAADADGDAITSLTADLSAMPAGSNASFTPGAGNTTGTLTWTPAYVDGRPAPYSVTFTATNALSGSAASAITVANVDRAPAVTAPAAVSGPQGAQVTVSVTAADPDGDAIASLTADLSALPAGNNAVFTAGPGNTSGTLTWTPATGNARANPYNVAFTATNALGGSATTGITVTNPNQPPHAVLSLTPSTGNAPLSVSASGAGSTDPDNAVASYRFDFGDGTIMGPQPGATATHGYSVGSYTVTLTVADVFGATNSTTAPVIVAAVGPGTNLVGNPSFETNTTGWSGYTGATLLRVNGGFDGSWALQMTGPSPAATFGVNDSPNWVLSSPAAGTRYRFTAWVRSSLYSGQAKLQVREYLNNVKVGTTTLSPAVTLSPTWQQLTVDYVTVSAGSSLDFQVMDATSVAGEVFLTDNLSIRIVTGGAMVAGLGNLQSPEPLPVSLTATLWPNPTSSGSVLQFGTPREGPAQIELYDVRGRQVREVLNDGTLPAGMHTLWIADRAADGTPLAAGIYYYRIRAGGELRSGRLVIVR